MEIRFEQEKVGPQGYQGNSGKDYQRKTVFDIFWGSGHKDMIPQKKQIILEPQADGQLKVGELKLADAGSGTVTRVDKIYSPEELRKKWPIVYSAWESTPKLSQFNLPIEGVETPRLRKNSIFTPFKVANPDGLEKLKNTTLMKGLFLTGQEETDGEFHRCYQRNWQKFILAKAEHENIRNQMALNQKLAEAIHKQKY